MSQLVPDWAIKSEVNKSLGQSVFKYLIGRWVSLYYESVSQSVFKSSIGRYVSLYSYFNQSVLMS